GADRPLGCRWWPLFSESASSLRRPETASQVRIQTTLCVARVACCFQKNGKPGEHQRAASSLLLRSEAVAQSRETGDIDPARGCFAMSSVSRRPELGSGRGRLV